MKSRKRTKQYFYFVRKGQKCENLWLCFSSSLHHTLYKSFSKESQRGRKHQDSESSRIESFCLNTSLSRTDKAPQINTSACFSASYFQSFFPGLLQKAPVEKYTKRKSEKCGTLPIFSCVVEQPASQCCLLARTEPSKKKILNNLRVGLVMLTRLRHLLALCDITPRGKICHKEKMYCNKNHQNTSSSCVL